MNLGTSLHWVSNKMKDKVCLIEGNIEVSYSELWKNIETLAKAFLKIGIKENDKVAVILPNCKEFIYCFYSLASINAISVPVDTCLTYYELKKIFKDCSPKAVITTTDLYKKNISSIINKDVALITVDDFDNLLLMGKRCKLARFSTGNDRIATINYTYRGLGKPLGAVLTHGNYHHGTIGYIRLTKFATSQRVLLITPMSHIFTLVSCVIVPLLRGATVIIMKSFIPTHIFKAIEKHKIDFIIAVPTIYISLLKNYKKSCFNISSLKYGITGGSYLTKRIQKEIKEEMGIELLQGYGLTETMPITCNPRSRNKTESLGIPGHEVKIKIVEESGIDASCGKVGEILVSGPTVMKCYYNKNGENKKYFEDGWFRTGDYGYMDEEGYLYFKGLKKNIIKVGGRNVDLSEVKDVLSSFPGAKDVCLDIVKNDLWGCHIFANLRFSSNERIDERALQSFCRRKLASYKIPRKINIIGDFKNKEPLACRNLA